MDNCCDNSVQILAYRVVQTIYERNTIPCEERLNGMMVTVVGSDSSYKQYMMQGGDPCVNSNWVEMLNLNEVANTLGHVTVETEEQEVITNLYLNERFPGTKEGFTVTFLDRNTSFKKVSGSRWAISNIKIQ